MAQTFNVAASNRQGPTDFGPFTVPVDCSFCKITVSIPTTADYENAANSFSFLAKYSPNNGVNWYERASYNWHGGQQIGKNNQVDPPPIIAFNVNPGEQITASLDVTLQMRLGATVELT
jgi:hypothetical protein